jgi:hypothetical protein
MRKETGRNSDFFMSQEINYADLTGQYDRMLKLSHQKSNKVMKYEGIYKAYMKMG